MPSPERLSIAAALITLALAGGCGTPAPVQAPPLTEGVIKEIEAWRTKHEVDYRRDWVTIAGLHDFKEGPNTAGSDKSNDIVLPPSIPPSFGRFVLKGQIVRFEPVKGVKATLDPGAADARDQPVTGPVDLQDDGSPGADQLVVGDVRMVVHVSGERRSLRVRDPNGEQAKSFLGFSWFPIEAQWRVTGRFIKDAEPKKLQVVNTFGDLDTYATEGVVEFTLLGQTLRLRPFTTRPKRFYFVFRDASSGQETYEAARFVYSNLLDDGTTVIDFNQAYNPPCAFNPYTTCPIPLKENRLPIKILAGEKAYPIHVPLPARQGG
jgi:uncharacterized protein (DUF1684 family)